MAEDGGDLSWAELLSWRGNLSACSVWSQMVLSIQSGRSMAKRRQDALLRPGELGMSKAGTSQIKPLGKFFWLQTCCEFPLQLRTRSICETQGQQDRGPTFLQCQKPSNLCIIYIYIYVCIYIYIYIYNVRYFFVWLYVYIEFQYPLQKLDHPILGVPKFYQGLPIHVAARLQTTWALHVHEEALQILSKAVGGTGTNQKPWNWRQSFKKMRWNTLICYNIIS